jgi:hypothetical protein
LEHTEERRYEAEMHFREQGFTEAALASAEASAGETDAGLRRLDAEARPGRYRGRRAVSWLWPTLAGIPAQMRCKTARLLQQLFDRAFGLMGKSRPHPQIIEAEAIEASK